ncbi:UvrD-helicase domain-containing protein [Proteus terrae]|uniref:UvrD-helicase domain-containing protein n=1 Tax=Proteus terrae TaxID=1574161 RepID=UPI0025AFBD43|nr:UvrD-helicase domain-containing protein [Proteus terrae]
MSPNEIKELEIRTNIEEHIDSFNSFRFNAGAGAGKTYALIETLKYVTINKIMAKKSQQKVVCITYTNVAVNEIKNRLGNSEIVKVSTIHERLWEIIKRAQPQILMCHREKVLEVKEKNEQELYHSNDIEFFISLNGEQQQEFTQYILKTKDIFYGNKNDNAEIFRNAYINNTDIDKPIFFSNCISNVGKFKIVVRLIYEIEKLNDCLHKIDSESVKRVDYDSNVNSDRLHHMKISHDTLLEYSLKLVKAYPTLCRIIVDSYPYFFIDEYQDTHINVVNFIKELHKYAMENNKHWMVGYFGDTAQCIYDDGIGSKITEVHDGIEDINNIFNRRSHEQIINVSNKIRADEIVQVPIFENRNTGSVSFFYNNTEDKLAVVQQFINDYKKDVYRNNGKDNYIKTDNDKIHCLVLTNRLMAQFNRFDDVYQIYQKSAIYHDNLNTQVLSHQLEKLHPTVLTIYRFVKLYRDIQQNTVSFYDIFGVYSNNITFSKASLVIYELKNKEVVSLKDWFELIFELLESSDAKDELGKALINCIKSEINSVSELRLVILDKITILMNKPSKQKDNNENVDSLLALPITSLINWVNFIDGIETDDISYHTYHGTKGEEYNNVAIILEHDFGRRDKNKFKNYFYTIQVDEEKRCHLLSNNITKKNHINSRNLLYVACSRAIKNLRILYLDDISEIKEGIESIFGESKPWPSE